MAKDKSADTKDEPVAKPRDRARDDELKKQLDLIKAVFDRTHGGDGEPVPIVAGEKE